MKTISLSNEHFVYPNGNLGSIHMSGNFFLDVENHTEKAIYFQYLGKMHWLPKSAFIGKSFHGTIMFSIKPFFANQIMSKF